MARFAFTPEQQELRSVLRSLFEKNATQQDVRSAIETPDGYSPALWRQLAEQIGVQGLAVPEQFGGVGYGDIELSIVLEEAGRALVCAPIFSTAVLATKALLISENLEAQKAYLPAIAAGELISTLAWTDESAELAPTTARELDGRWQLEGTKRFVLDGHLAQLLIVTAEVDGQPALFTVELPADGVAVETMTTMDLTRRQARLRFAGVAAELLVGPDRGVQVLDRVLTEARIALAVEQIGGAEACLEMAVEYAKIREQFGRPIGSFQAIKHRCADMLVEVELAKSTAYNALWALAEGSEPDEVALAASMAKALCSEAYVFVATENIQVHGGIGFSWEHAAHLYFRRARSSAVMLGDATFHRELIAQRLGV